MTTLELDNQMQKARVNTMRAGMLKKSWNQWFTSLNWYDSNVGSPDTLKEAKDRITAFETVNGESIFGAESVHKTIKLGSSSSDVEAWQKVLKIPVTGSFDQNTLNATKVYQREHTLTPDGIVGAGTWGTVREVSAKSYLQTVKQKIQSVGFLGKAIGAALGGGLVAGVIYKTRGKGSE